MWPFATKWPNQNGFEVGESCFHPATAATWNAIVILAGFCYTAAEIAF